MKIVILKKSNMTKKTYMSTEKELYERLKKKVYEIIYPNGMQHRYVDIIGELRQYAMLEVVVNSLDQQQIQCLEECISIATEPTLSLQDILRAIHIKHSYFNSLSNLLFAKTEQDDYDVLSEIHMEEPMENQEPEVLKRLLYMLEENT